MMANPKNSPHKVSIGSSSLLIIALLALLSLNSRVAFAQSSVQGFYRGHAFGTYAFTQAGPVAGSQGRTALIGIPCNGTQGVVYSNGAERGTATKTLSWGEISTSVVTNETSSSKTARSITTAQNMRLLDGLITLDAVEAVATTHAKANSIISTTLGSRFINLRISGMLIASANIAPNTRIDLPGVGYVILREVVQAGDNVTRGFITTNMLHVKVTNKNNPLGLPAGLDVIAGRAMTGFVRSSLQVALGSYAFAATAKTNIAAIQDQIGNLDGSWVGCEGTGGVTRVSAVNTVNVIGILSLGSGETTAFGNRTSTAAKARLTTTLQNINLLGGRITLDAVTGVAESRFEAGRGQSNTTGSRFVNLRIQGINGGQPLSTVAPNTKLNIPGVGTVILYEQNMRNSGALTWADVTMIRIIISADNTLGLSAGNEIRIAQARSLARPF